jgi:hypothetical protein
MELEKYLTENRKKLVEKWVSAVIETYPADSLMFFKKTKDPFANPVGTTIKRSIELLYDEVLKEKMDASAVKEAMEPIIRLRAVQEFTPSQALAFVFSLKPILKEALNKYRAEKNVIRFLETVAANTDELMLAAVDIYGQCRDKIYTLRINQSKESLKKLLIKKELICEIPETDFGLKV